MSNTPITDALKPKTRTTEAILKSKTFHAAVAPMNYLQYKTRAIELGLSNADFFAHLLDIEEKYSSLCERLMGEPSASEDGSTITVELSLYTDEPDMQPKDPHRVFKPV